MVEEAKTVKKTVASKAAKPAASAVWPFPEVEKAPKAAAKKPAAKPVAAKPAAKAVAEKKPAKPAAKTDVEKKPAAKAAAKPAKTAQPSAQERYRMVETAAYYIAERSGFQGCTTDHWAAAEIEIAAKLAS